MSKKKRLEITPTELSAEVSIHSSEIKSGHVRFSFKHLDLSHGKFGISHRDSDYFHKLLERLKSVSQMKASELRASHSKAVRSHPIEWRNTTEPDGFRHLNIQLQQITPYQFQCERNEYGRVHGFYIDNVFFIVWLDPDHKLYA